MEFEATNDFKENMMMKASGLVVAEENMSNLTSASGEVSASSAASRSIDEIATDIFTHQPPPPKKKRNLPGNPDPNADVIALSPRTLLATNRFICEICNKGFQRDQNLQLHRRGHNLPWKLKQRSSTEVIRKKVYVCPEETCVHHDPSRALGDLTGIKKHFSRKHGEKKWKCEKCSKKYAVQSDWKAHSKICGTKEYRCDCGKVFSRRDSFITHRAFCDVLTEESSRAIIPNSLLSNFTPQLHGHGAFQPPLSSVKREDQQQLRHINNNINNIPPWLSCPPTTGGGGHPPPALDLSSPLFSTNHQNPNPNNNNNNTSPTLSSSFHQAAASASSVPHMSATALLQKAAQMGVTMSNDTSSASHQQSPAAMLRAILPGHQQHHQPPHHHHHHYPHNQYMPSDHQNLVCSTSAVGSREDNELSSGCGYGSLSSFGNKAGNHINAVVTSAGFSNQQYFSAAAAAVHTTTTAVNVHDMMNYSLTTGNGFDEAAFSGMLAAAGGGVGNVTGGSDGLTRDFLGLKGYPDHRDFINVTGFDHNHINAPSSSTSTTASASACGQQNLNPRTWRA